MRLQLEDGMSALASTDRKTDAADMAALMPYPGVTEGILIREKVALLGGTLIVLVLQLVFRTTMLLRRWNY
jgi:hypothetical protein